MEPETSRPDEAVALAETGERVPSGTAFRRDSAEGVNDPGRPADAAVRILLEGDLAGFPPADVVQWVAAGPGDSILVASSGPGYRFRFHRGRLVSAGRGRLGEDFLGHLLRFQHLSMMETGETREAGRRLGMPAALAAFELRLLERPRQVLADYSLEVIYDFLQETSGTFFVAQPATEFPSVLVTDTDPAVAVLKGLHRLDEERALGSWLPQAGCTLVWRPSIAEALGESTIPLSGRIERLLVEGPLTLESLIDQLGVETHAARISLAHLHRSGYLEIRPRNEPHPQGAKESSSRAPLESGRACRFVASPTPDQAIFLTEIEALCLKALHARESSSEELSHRLGVSSGVMEQVVAELERQGLIEAHTAAGLRRLPLRWAAAAALGGLTLGALWVAHAAGGASQGFPSLGLSTERRGIPVAESSILPALELRRRPRAPEVRSVEPLPAAPEQPIDAPPEVSSSAPTSPASREDVEPPPAPSGNRDAAFESEPLHKGSPRRVLAAAVSPPPPSLRPRATQPARTATRPPKAAKPARVPVGGEFEPAVGGAVAVPEPPPVEPLPAPGTLVVNAVPFAYVRIDGQEHGVTPVRLKIEGGAHAVEIYREGYRSQSRRVTVEPDAAVAVSFAVEVEPERGASDDESAPP